MSDRPGEAYFLVGAAAAGLTHAGFSLYWALGGRWLLPTVGQWAVTLAAQAPVAAGLLLIIVAAVKSAVAIIPLVVIKRPLPRPRVYRVFAWLAAIVLTGYGALNSVAAWLVLWGAVRPKDGFERQAMVGHAYLWDPLFLVWGLLLAAGLVTRSADRRKRARVSPGIRLR
jgi:hypothetical protein